MGEINFVADLRVLKLKRVGELIFMLWSGGTCSCVGQYPRHDDWYLMRFVLRAEETLPCCEVDGIASHIYRDTES